MMFIHNNAVSEKVQYLYFQDQDDVYITKEDIEKGKEI